MCLKITAFNFTFSCLTVIYMLFYYQTVKIMREKSVLDLKLSLKLKTNFIIYAIVQNG